MNENAVTVKVDSSNREKTVLKGAVKTGKHIQTPELIIDSDPNDGIRSQSQLRGRLFHREVSHLGTENPQAPGFRM